MPITQDRLISLINAATDYQLAFAEAKRVIVSQVEASERSQITQTEALTNIRNFISAPDAFMQRPIETITALIQEKAHFRATAQANRRAARRAELRRRRNGVEPRADITSFVRQEPRQPQHWQPPQPAAAINLAYDPSDPEESLTASLSFSNTEQPSYISEAEKRRIDIELVLINEAPEAHITTLTDPASETVRCRCGWTGAFAQWQAHLPGAKP